MITIERLFDIGRIKHYIEVDNIYKNMLLRNDLEDFFIDVLFTIWIVIYKNSSPIGVMFFKSMGGRCQSFHGGIYKKYRGKELVNIIQIVLNKIKHELNCKFVTNVPESNKAANAFVKKLGMKELTKVKDGYVNDNLIFYSE